MVDAVKEIKKNGYIVFPRHYKITNKHLSAADLLMKDYENYKIGRRYVTNFVNALPDCLKNLIYTSDIKRIFDEYSSQNNKCMDVMLTNEYKTGVIERNGWLHYDRWRSLKAMVYLTDVDKMSGAFSVVPGSHLKGSELRRENSPLLYDNRKNRIEIDYPELWKEPLPLTATAGTLILFDSDVFHLGGKVSKENSRTIIRSHWYPNLDWRDNSL